MEWKQVGMLLHLIFKLLLEVVGAVGGQTLGQHHGAFSLGQP
jgi:hypothetical protein